MGQCYQQEGTLIWCITEYLYRGMQCSFDCVLIAGFAATLAIHYSRDACFRKQKIASLAPGDSGVRSGIQCVSFWIRIKPRAKRVRNK